MSFRSRLLISVRLICVAPLYWAPLLWAHLASAQQAAPSASPAAPRATAPAAAAVPPNAASEAARKAEILSSDCWRRATFELNEWLRVQKVYPPAEVARIRTDFAARVDRMSASELQLVLADLQKKFQMLNTTESRELRAWFGSYLSMFTERGREGVLRMIPNFDTMNSAQLQQTLSRIAQYREGRTQQSAEVQQLRNKPKDPWNSNVAAPARRSAPSAGYRSPYRPPSVERPFDNVRVGGTRTRSIDPNGGMWVHTQF